MAKKKTYEVVLTNTQVRRMFVEATSAEQACKRLQRQLAGKPRDDDDNPDSEVICDIWSDPSDEGEAWQLSSPELQEEFPDTAMVWNGSHAKIFSMEEIVAGSKG